MSLSRPKSILINLVRVRVTCDASPCRSNAGLGTSAKSFGSIPTAADLVAKAPEKWQPYLQVIRADKPIGTWLLYWPCTWSIALATPAGQLPSLYLLSLFGCGAFLMRGAGCVINDLWDKDFDRKVERTRMRPLACGSMKTKEAIALLGGLLLASSSILFQLNNFSIAVGISSMLLVIAYPAAKRFTYWPQFVLGMTFNWGALLGWTAVTGQLSLAPIALYLAALQWTLVYDTIYAHQDKADDIMIGVKSTALRFGDQTKQWLSGFATTTVGGLALAGYLADQTWPYYIALGGTAAHLAWQISTVNINDGSDCWQKFKSNSWMGVILFSGIVLGNFVKEKDECKRSSPTDMYQDNIEEIDQ